MSGTEETDVPDVSPEAQTYPGAKERHLETFNSVFLHTVRPQVPASP